VNKQVLLTGMLERPRHVRRRWGVVGTVRCGDEVDAGWGRMERGGGVRDRSEVYVSIFRSIGV
jgi:hypothetical protein